MTFVLVRGRTPLPKNACAFCSQSISVGYLRDVETWSCYCDLNCYVSTQAGRLLIGSFVADQPGGGVDTTSRPSPKPVGKSNFPRL